MVITLDQANTIKEADRKENQLQRDEEAKEARLKRFAQDEVKQGIDPSTMTGKLKRKLAELLQDQEKAGDDDDDDHITMARPDFRLQRFKLTDRHRESRRRLANQLDPTGPTDKEGLIPKYEVRETPLFRPGLGPEPRLTYDSSGNEFWIPKANYHCDHMMTGGKKMEFVYKDANRQCDGCGQ